MDKKYDRWTDDKVQALFSVFAEDKIQREMEKMTRNEKTLKLQGQYSPKMKIL